MPESTTSTRSCSPLNRWLIAIGSLGVAAVLVTIIFVTCIGSQIPHSSNYTELIILATTDLHSNLVGYDYNTNQATDDGLARIASFVDSVRAQHPNVIVLDNGDAFTGSVYPYIGISDTPGPQGAQAMITAMNSVGYDVLNLGNHDFYGNDVKELTDLNHLITYQSFADFTFISSNVLGVDGNSLFRPYAILEAANLKIGVIGGLTTTAFAYADSELSNQVEISPLVPTVQKYASELSDEVDLLIALVHTGWSSYADPKPYDDIAEQIALTVPSVDVVIAGHAHESVVVNDDNFVAAAAAIRGVEVMMFTLTFDEHHQLIDSHAELVPMATYEPSQTILDLPSTQAAQQTAIDYFK